MSQSPEQPENPWGASDNCYWTMQTLSYERRTKQFRTLYKVFQLYTGICRFQNDDFSTHLHCKIASTRPPGVFEILPFRLAERPLAVPSNKDHAEAVALTRAANGEALREKPRTLVHAFERPLHMNLVGFARRTVTTPIETRSPDGRWPTAGWGCTWFIILANSWSEGTLFGDLAS